MVCESQGEDFCKALKAYVCQLSLEKKSGLIKIYNQAVSSFLGAWRTLNGVTFVTLRSRKNIVLNLSLVMFKYMIELGHEWYFFARSYWLDFEPLMLLALHFLPNK